MLSSYHLQCLQNLAHGEEKKGEGDGGDDGGADGKEELPWDELSTIIREINKSEYKRMQNLLFDYKR